MLYRQLSTINGRILHNIYTGVNSLCISGCSYEITNTSFVVLAFYIFQTRKCIVMTNQRKSNDHCCGLLHASITSINIENYGYCNVAQNHSKKLWYIQMMIYDDGIFDILTTHWQRNLLINTCAIISYNSNSTS